MHNQFEPDPVHQNPRFKNRLPENAIHENADTSLEQYLNQLCAPLERDLSAEEYQATRQELRAHLLLSAAAHEELGATTEEALKAAFEGFGNPQQLGRTLAQEKSAPIRANRRLARWGRVLGGLAGGYAALNLTFLCSLLLRMDPHQGDVTPPILLQLLLLLLGGRLGWLLASGRRAAAGSSLAALAGSQVGMGAGIASVLLADHYGWLAVTYSINSVSLCFFAGLGATVGWRLWKRPKSLAGSILLGSAIFGLPMLLISLRLYLYPDYRNAHILSILARSILLWCASGGITGATMGCFTRSLVARMRRIKAGRGAFPFARRVKKEDADLLAS
jgi:hypothetical protein